MTKKLKVWMMVISAACFASGTVALVPACRSAQAQDAPTQTVTAAEALTIALLQEVVRQLIELNHNVGRLPAPMDQ